MVRAHADPEFDIDAVPLDDPLTLELFQRGQGIGVFQMEFGCCEL